VEGGDYRVRGQLTSDGQCFLNGNVRIGGDLILSSTSKVDIETVVVYDFTDPLIELNTAYTGAAKIDDAGLTIYRGVGPTPKALLHFQEDDVARTILKWRVGLEGDLLPIARTAESMTLRGALYWEAAQNHVESSSAVLINATDFTSTVPFFFNEPIATAASVVRYNELKTDMLALECYDTTVYRDSLVFGFTTVTSDAHPFDYAATISSTLVQRFLVTAPEHARAKYIFDDDIMLGTDADTAALIRTDKAALRIEGAQLSLCATPGADEVVVTPALVTVNANLDLTGHTVSVESIATGLLGFTLLTGFEPIPVIGGWGGVINYSTISYTESATVSGPYTQYEVQLDYTIPGAGAPDELITLVAPINIGGNTSKVRQVHGVHRELLSDMVYGFPPNDVYIQPAFDLSPDGNPLLTPANLVGYHFLSIRTTKKTGVWRITVTIATMS
jgi:hypothetical protein